MPRRPSLPDPGSTPALKPRATRVLVTRALHQQAGFCQQLRALGMEPVSLPSLVIEATGEQRDVRFLAQHNTAVFTSSNAVNHAHELQAFPWPIDAIEAIGPATAERLKQAGCRVSSEPSPPYNSEAWLKHFDQRQNAQPVLIVTGEGGREAIAQGLQARSAAHSVWPVYRRAVPVPDIAALDRLFTDKTPDIISVTSDEALRNLVTLCTPTHLTVLRQRPLVVNSARAAQLATALQFQKMIYIADPPGDDGQIACITEWKQRQGGPRH